MNPPKRRRRAAPPASELDDDDRADRPHDEPKLRVGDQVGEWLLTKYEPSSRRDQRRNSRWLCQCSCGTVRWVCSTRLRDATSKSCGHHRATGYEPGMRIGEWTLLEYKPGQITPRLPAKWRCRCDCGKEAWVQTNNLRSGASRSCGHGQVRTKFHLFPEREHLVTGR